uniref:Uncharacterized protein n=1 Tax=Brassica oleracea var. oleracea TaxID=109376 RepID=A0A0D3A8Q0_BRAOL
MFEADQRRLFSQFEVREFCDNLVEGGVKALKDASQIHKKSTSTCAPIAEPSLFISETSKDFEEKPFDYTHQGPLLGTRRPMDVDLYPIFDEEDDHLDELGPTFVEKALSIIFDNMIHSFKKLEPDKFSEEKRFSCDSEINHGLVLSFDQFMEHNKSLDYPEKRLELILQQLVFCSRKSFDSFVFKENSFSLRSYGHELITGILFSFSYALDDFLVSTLLEQNSYKAETDFCVRLVLEMFYCSSCLENILIYNTFFDKSADPWISNSRFEIDLLCSKSEKLAHVLNLFFRNCVITCLDTILVYNTYFDRIHDDLKRVLHVLGKETLVSDLNKINIISLQEVSGTEAEFVLISLRFGDACTRGNQLQNSKEVSV